MLLQRTKIIPPNKLSLLTLSSNLNTTTNNQGNHCIIAHNAIKKKVAVQSDNQVLDINGSSESKCQDFGSSNEASAIYVFVFNLFSWLFKHKGVSQK